MKNKKPVFDLHPEGSCSAKKYQVYKRKIKRPKINYLLAVVFVVGVIAAGFISAEIFGLIFINENHKAIEFCLSWFWAFSLAYMIVLSRYVLIFFVLLYQRFASENVRQRCNMTPSCSEYAIIAFKKYGTVLGIIKTIKRIKRCSGQFEEDYP